MLPRSFYFVFSSFLVSPLSLFRVSVTNKADARAFSHPSAVVASSGGGEEEPTEVEGADVPITSSSSSSLAPPRFQGKVVQEVTGEEADTVVFKVMTE